MSNLPYVPWFHGDFLRATAGWTLLERAAYWMLLCAQWEMGALPNDPARLASIVGMEQSEFATLWPLLSPKFKTTKLGLVNARMKKHRVGVVRYRAKLSAAGRKGMRNRWGDRGEKVIELRPRSKPNE